MRTRKRRLRLGFVWSPIAFILATLFLLTLFLVATRPVARAADTVTPVQFTAEQDHQRMLDLLHIASLRPGPDGDPKSPRAANFDEAKVAPYSLPDPLKLKNGKPAENAKTWWDQRRPEIVEDFDRDVYGRVPANVPRVDWQVKSTTQELEGEVEVVRKSIVGHVDNSSYPAITVDLQLTLTTPAKAEGPVPVMMELGLSPEALAAIAKRFPEAMRAGPGPTWQQQVLTKGWGYAVLIPVSVQADDGSGLTQGIIGLVNKGEPRKLEDWGALRAWAWGASRALDYLETDKSVDARHVGIEGLSRYGKAALVTMAYDPRFAIGFIGSSGAGGAKILRRTFGEQVENIASTAEYHWMAGNFLKYAGPLAANDLPVDAHELIALCAPRPVFVSSGSLEVEGGWVDAKGMFLGAAGAGAVYRLLGKKDLGTSEFPPPETALIEGDIAFRQHSGGHTTGPNWPTFLELAGRYIKSENAAAFSKAAGKTGGLEIALTFDDLPVHGPLPAGLTRVDIAKSIIGALQAAHAPPIYAFVNAKRLDEDPSSIAVLKLWREAGYPLGNHTYSHMDPNANSLAAFEEDILKGEPPLRQLMGDQDWHWLRYPFLREGETAEKHKAIVAFLKEHGYRVAEITLSFGDYAYNDPYARCVAKKDGAGIALLKKSYMEGAEEELSYGHTASMRLYGRDIRHIMLLHLGGFETVMLPQLLDLLERRGFKLITLPEAANDPAYAVDPLLTSDWGGGFLDQMLRARHDWVPMNFKERFAKLDAICR